MLTSLHPEHSYLHRCLRQQYILLLYFMCGWKEIFFFLNFPGFTVSREVIILALLSFGLLICL